jgi:acyl-CoA thioester hydrolase
VAFLLQNHETDAVLARGTITQVFVDPDTRKSIAIPEPFRSNILERQGNWLVE